MLSSVANAEPKYIDYLDIDPPIRGQEYACVSFVSPKGRQHANLLGLKIRGVFRTEKEAGAHVKTLQKTDGDFNIYICPIGTWVPWEPDPNDILDQEYLEPMLNTLVKESKESGYLAEEEEQRRKRKLMKQAILDGQSGRQKELAEQKENPVSLSAKLEELPENIKRVRKELEKLETQRTEVQAVWDSYTPEEIKASMDEFEEYKKGLTGGGNEGGSEAKPEADPEAEGEGDSDLPQSFGPEKIDEFKKQREDAIQSIVDLKKKVENGK